MPDKSRTRSDNNGSKTVTTRYDYKDGSSREFERKDGLIVDGPLVRETYTDAKGNSKTKRY